MDSDPPKVIPKGKRYIVKKPCADCDSKGYLTSQSRKECENCKGAGWIADKKRGEIICPSCEGHRTIKVEIRRKCPKCHGNGYLVRIMQDFIHEALCETCTGTGKLKCGVCKGKVGKHCRKCKGAGGIPEGSKCKRCGRNPSEFGGQYKIYNVRWWLINGDIGPEWRDRTNFVEAVAGLDIGQPVEKDGRFIARTRFCKSCSKEVLKVNCPTCNAPTVPRIRQYDHECCPDCIARIYLDCPDCHGSGAFACPSCNSTGFTTCSACHGAGRTRNIVEKEV